MFGELHEDHAITMQIRGPQPCDENGAKAASRVRSWHERWNVSMIECDAVPRRPATIIGEFGFHTAPPLPSPIARVEVEKAAETLDILQIAPFNSRLAITHYLATSNHAYNSFVTS